VADLLLAELPAEQHLLAVPKRREVDEARVEVLDDRAALVDRVHSSCDLDALVPLRLFELGELARVDAAAVAGDALRECLSR
jgi:hypothetical protein